MSCFRDSQQAKQTRVQLNVIQCLVVFWLLFLGSSFVWSSQPKPNILLVVVDDMGFTDLGSFGGEIHTPHLDALAYEGIRFTNFQAAPTCSPSRSMLLTGVDSHKAGLGNMHEEMAPNQTGKAGYEGYLNDQVVSVATLLKDNGYHTYMAGKWHLGLNDESSPYAKGFEKSFSMLTGGASHFSDMKPAYAPNPEAKAPYRENGKLLAALPESFDYSSRFYARRIIDNIEDNRATGKPFFAYLAYTAPHWPLQAPNDVLDKYKGNYNAGYEVLHQQRLKQQAKLGLFENSLSPAPYPVDTPRWNQLSDQQKAIEARQMEIYAAMIDEVDSNTGRVINYLKDNNLFENTLVVFLSDNGAEGHNLDSTFSKDMFPKIRAVIDNSHDFSPANMGKLNSYTFVGAGWAYASSPALKHGKGTTSEGGTRVAAFVHFPKALRSKSIEHNLVSIKDITPTLLDLADIEHPTNEYQGRTIEPMTGVSLLPLLQDAETPSVSFSNRVLGTELMGKRAIRQGDWKLVHMPLPYGDNQWQLYNLKEDLGEANDLAAQHPEKLKQLKALWQKYVTGNNVILPDWVSGY